MRIRSLRLGGVLVVGLSLSACQTSDLIAQLEKFQPKAETQTDNRTETSETSEASETSQKVSPYQSQIDQFIRLGDRTRASGDLANAIGFYQKAYGLDKSYRDSLYRLVDSLTQIGDRRGSERLLADALSDSPNDVVLLRKYGNVLIERDKLPQALIQFERALELAPDQPETLNSMAVAYDLQGRHGEAQTLYQKSLGLNAENQRTLSNYALSLALSGQMQQALAQLTPFETDPTVSKRLKLNLALIYGLDGQMEAARRVAGQVLDREAVENNIVVYENLRRMSAKDRTDALLKTPEKSPQP